MIYKILVTTLFISGLTWFQLVHAQSGSKSSTPAINNRGKYSDSIIKHEWNPTSLSDSLLFDGKQKFTYPNTKLTLIPPKTFRVDNQGNLIHDWTGTSIQCTIINTNYFTLLKTVKKETFEEQGFTYINQQKLSTKTNNESTLFLIGFTLNGMEYERIIYFIGNNNNQTAWLSVNYPIIMKSLIFETIENCLTTIEF